MPTIIELPQVGESVVEGIVGKWLKKPGDRVERYDPLVEVVTDKVTMEVPSPYAGVLSRLLVEEGDTVAMGAPIAEVETEEATAPTAAPVTGPPSREPDTAGYLVKDEQPMGPTGGGVIQEAGEAEAPERKRHSPAVRRLAQEHGVDLNLVQGTGLGGRVTRDDVLAFIEQQGQAPTVTPMAIVSEEEVLPLSPVRRMIAENMARSASQIPHAWSVVEADVTPLVRHREVVKEAFQKQEGVELTYLPFIVKAVAETLKGNPLLNSTWGGDKIVLKKRVNIGIAVAAPEGLIVPVIHNADSLSITELAHACRDLTSRARQGRLTLEDVQGGTFTVNNTGALGSLVSQPIINYPQAGILTSESIQKRPIVVDDAIAIRSMMNLCLSFDHRIVDGSEAGRFLQGIKARLESMGPGMPLC